MRADVHGGSEHTLQSEAGYIDARPYNRQLDENLLRRTVGPYMRVTPHSPGRHAYFHDPDGNCIEIIDLYKGQPNTTET